MTDAQAKAVQLLQLPDEDYFALDDRRVQELQLRWSGRSGLPPRPDAAPKFEPALAIGAPGAVNLDRRPTVPVLVAIAQNGQRQWEVSLNPNTWAVISDLKTGAVELAQPFVKGKRERRPQLSREGAPPDRIERDSTSYGVRPIDLRPALPSGARAGRIAIRVISYDLLSNGVVVELQGGAPPEPLKPAARSAAVTPAAAGAVPAGLAVDLPGKASRALGIPLEVKLGAPASDLALIPDIADPDHGLLQVSVLLVKLDQSPVPQLDLLVPARRGGASIQAAFSVDLAKALSGEAVDGLYQAYVVCGALISGPHPVQVGK